MNSFGEGTPGADRRRTTRLALSLPADAAERLVTLLNSDTPEGDRARADLGVISAKLVDKMVDTVALLMAGHLLTMNKPSTS